MGVHACAAKPIRMISTPAGPSSMASLCSDGIWSAGSVGDFADELFEDVFECNQAAGLAVLVCQPSEVRAAAAQGCERGLQGGGGWDVSQWADAAAVHRPVPGCRVGVQDVGEVDVADEIGSGRWVIGLSYRKAGVAGGGDEVLDIGRSDIRCDSHQSLERQSDDLDLGFLESQRSREQLMLVGLEEPLFAGFADQRRYGVSVDDVTNFTYGFDAQQLQYPGCHGGQAADDRAEDAHKDQ